MTTESNETDYWSGYAGEGDAPMVQPPAPDTLDEAGPAPDLLSAPEDAQLAPADGAVLEEQQLQQDQVVTETEIGTSAEAAGDQAVNLSPAPAPAHKERQDPVVEVPPEHQDISTDTTLADEQVGVLADGGVVDTRGQDTVVTTNGGVQVTRKADGSVTVDADISNNDTPGAESDDVSELNGDGVLMTEDGTKVQIDGDKVTVTQLDGTRFVITPDGQVEVDLSDRKPDPDGGKDAGQGEDADSDGKGDEDKVEDEEDKKDDKDAEDEQDSGGGGGGNTGGGGGNQGGGGNPGGGGGNQGGGGGNQGGGPGTNTPPTTPPPTTPPPTTPPPTPTPPTNPPDEPGGPKEDTQFNTGDMREDAKTYADRANRAAGIAKTFGSLKSGVPSWGLWFAAAGPYGEAIDRCVTIYTDAEKALDRMSEKLTQTATQYDQTEMQNQQQATRTEP
ncbi:hypothetical protein [Enemella evansiae]|uniref:hypothetical protein n=1 Tax=Enemella evansiae TaxID=2016499 RepID=UPI00114083A3|nr:hypothetical protein [Enemella evansiae]